MPSTFVVLDTNILFRIVTQGEKGCEHEHFQDLKQRIDKSEVTLLLPEVIKLEFEKLTEWMEETYKVEVEKVRDFLLKQLDGYSKVWKKPDR